MGSEYTQVSKPTMERFEDLVQFITTTERHHQGNEPEAMKKGVTENVEIERNIPTGMSFLGSDRSCSSAFNNKPPVYIPAAF